MVRESALRTCQRHWRLKRGRGDNSRSRAFIGGRCGAGRWRSLRGLGVACRRTRRRLEAGRRHRILRHSKLVDLLHREWQTYYNMLNARCSRNSRQHSFLHSYVRHEQDGSTMRSSLA